MNKTDLQAHATKIGLVPIDDANALKKRLLREFVKHVNSFQVPKSAKGSQAVSKKALKILGEGK